MNWLVWLHAAGFRGESRRALNKFFFLKRRGTAVDAEVLSGSFNKAAIAERPVAMPAMAVPEVNAVLALIIPSVQLLGELPLGLIVQSACSAKLPR